MSSRPQPNERGRDERLVKDLSSYPWRYCCLACGSHTVEVRAHNGHPGEHVEVDPSMFNPHESHVHDFRCQACGYTSDRVRDKQTNDAVLRRGIE